MHGLPGQCIQIENEKTQLSRWQTQMTVHMKKTAHILTDLKEKIRKELPWSIISRTRTKTREQKTRKKQTKDDRTKNVRREPEKKG